MQNDVDFIEQIEYLCFYYNMSMEQISKILSLAGKIDKKKGRNYTEKYLQKLLRKEDR